MRTQDEILAYYQAHAADDYFGFILDVLAPYLRADQLAAYATQESLAGWRPKVLDQATLLPEIADYLEFAWGKAEDHRGLSAGRSIQKLSVMAWLAGREDLVDQMAAAPYPHYGAPKLRVLAEGLGLPVPTTPTLARMMRGARCSDECTSCG